jgi:hypothetical protein
MAESNKYAGFSDATPIQDDKFASLSAKVEEVKAQEALCERLAQELGSAQERLRDMNSRELPAMLDELGLEEFKTKSGLKITVKENIVAGISADNKPEAHDWLDKNGHSGLLKRQVAVMFNKDQAEMASCLANQLSSRFPGVSTTMNVHPSTLKAWAKEMLAGGKDFPLELFGVQRLRVAQIHEAKK